jgi:hypothetical protein
MRIYMFKSQPKPELRAFADDRSGNKLPEKFAPWHVTGVVTEERKPPFNLPRGKIEDAIREQGFQLWRMKAAAST